MQLQREFRLAFGLIFGLQLATSFGAIALLSRMGPAIERVAAENVDSLAAIEDMLAALALDRPGDDFTRAFELARGNVTEPAEEPLLDEIERRMTAAFQGDATARASVVRSLRNLSAVNHDAMYRSDKEAQRLATAGAWAAAMLALLSFLAATLLAQRADHRVIAPLFDIHSTLQAAKRGDARRRCNAFRGSAEIEQIALEVNSLLDAR